MTNNNDKPPGAYNDHNNDNPPGAHNDNLMGMEGAMSQKKKNTEGKGCHFFLAHGEKIIKLFNICAYIIYFLTFIFKNLSFFPLLFIHKKYLNL